MDLHTSLTLRYTVALGTVAAVLLTAHLTSSHRISVAKKDATLIDVSGQQRMLSQRIGLIAAELAHERNAVTRSGQAKKLEAAIDRMEDNHATLKVDWRERAADEQAVYAAYLQVDGPASKIERFIETAQRLLARHDGEGGREVWSDDEISILKNTAIDNTFLGQLDSIVKRYALESTARNDGMSRFENLTLAFGLCVLLIEVLFIFRPMVRNIVRCTRVLDEANAELRDFATSLSHDLRAPIVDSIGLIRSVDEALASGKVIEASAATRHVYASMITFDGVLEELLEMIRRQREAIVHFATLGRRQAEPHTAEDSNT